MILVSEQALSKALKLFDVLSVIDALEFINKLSRCYRKNGQLDDAFYKALYAIPDHDRNSDYSMRIYRRNHAIFRVLVGQAPYYVSRINLLMKDINGQPLSTDWLTNQN